MKISPNRITPDKIMTLDSNEVFVFGSNLSGYHGAGAAYTAIQWGAKMGVGIGLYGQTYAIPTKDKNIITMTVGEIRPFVDDFIEFAKNHSKTTFLVTEIGCGLAGYSPKDIAPLFSTALNVSNITLPFKFWNVLNG